ncbi:uncharacterized protein LOC114941855 [Nylanderia fulva]|uniref:uncharacterized protein LOC114941855 n=1 Tax=Nylanderia fulva TaxID=613905 RepID=UPI0010FB8F02|nr:uncharacterized protein LOC114941855 [Nylanderia fulva]
MADFDAFIDNLDGIIKQIRSRIIICGDFNAKSHLWGSKTTDKRGRLIDLLASSNGLSLVNIGDLPTCIRPQGSSVIDLTWASHDMLSNICDWKVRNDMESLSDHVYITFTYLDRNNAQSPPKLPSNRWNFRKMDRSLFIECLEWYCDFNSADVLDGDAVNPIVDWISQTMADACSVSTPRSSRSKRKCCYWWTEDINKLKKTTIGDRRALTRPRKKKNADLILSANQKKKKKGNLGRSCDWWGS